MLFHKSGNTEREGALTVFHLPSVKCVSASWHMQHWHMLTSIATKSAKSQVQPIKRARAWPTGPAAWQEVPHSVTSTRIRCVTLLVRYGQDRKKYATNEYVSPHLAFSLVPLYVQILWHVRFVMTSHLEFDGGYCNIYRGTHGGVVAKALRYKPAGRVIDSRWCHWNFSVT